MPLASSINQRAPSPEHDWYDVLGVQPNATRGEIRKAFQQKAREKHPDKVEGTTAEKKLKLLNQAYGILNDTEQRKAYDNSRRQPSLVSESSQQTQFDDHCNRDSRSNMPLASSINQRAPSPEHDWYDVLGVQPNATRGEIRKAFQQKAREKHPDKVEGTTAEKKLKLLNQAYGILNDTEQRKAYDNSRRQPSLVSESSQQTQFDDHCNRDSRSNMPLASSINQRAPSPEHDWYDVLGVQPNATRGEIRKAFHQKAREKHPDKVAGTTAEKKMKLLNQAYGVLNDTEQRKAYDNSRWQPSLVSESSQQTQFDDHCDGDNFNSRPGPNAGHWGGGYFNPHTYSEDGQPPMEQPEHDWYDVLGVQSNATRGEIRKAFHQKAREKHPDKVAGTTAEKKMKLLNQAYGVLNDTEQRKAYDNSRWQPSLVSESSQQTQFDDHCDGDNFNSRPGPNAGHWGGGYFNPHTYSEDGQPPMEQPEHDWYDVLGVQSNATRGEIRKAFHQKARKKHPDKVAGTAAEKKMKLLNQAYGVLNDPEQRKAYNNSRRQPSLVSESSQQTQFDDRCNGDNFNSHPGTNAGLWGEGYFNPHTYSEAGQPPMEQPEHDWYDVLGVQPSATRGEIRKAFHQEARKNHPDKVTGTASEERMKLLNQAYGVLNDPEQRKVYDDSRQQPSFAYEASATYPC